jgi:phage terminase large subunit-like protein
MTWPELLKSAGDQYRIYKPRTVLVEDSASGQSLIQQLQVQSKPMIPVHASVRGQQDKRAFVNPVTGFCQAGRVALPQGPDSMQWTHRFVSSCAGFNPDREQKDDDVLAFAHGVRWLSKSSGVSLDDDCIMLVGATNENGGIGVRLASNLGIGGSGESAVGAGCWFDQM